MTWDSHTSRLINGIKYCCRAFNRSCKFLNIDTRKLLYNAVIASRFNYCDAIWDCCSVRNKQRLQTIQNKCARHILDRLPGTSAAPLLQELGWINLEKKRKLHKCVLLHRLLQNRGPNPLIDMLNPYMPTSTAGTRGAGNGNLFIPRYHTNYIRKSYFMDAALLWNTIPVDIKSTESSASFKEKMHIHLLNATPE